MARFVLVLLLVAAGALVIALFFDLRGRRDARFDRLRQSFLHGLPLQGYSRPASLVEIVHPKGVTFRAPGAWTVDMREGPPAPAAVPDGGRCVEIEVLHLEGHPSGSLTDALKSLPAEGGQAVEELPNGHVLMKTVEPTRGPQGLLATYTWRLGHATPGHGFQLAVFRLRLPVETAAEVIAQVDLATLEREVREATFSESTGVPPGA
jgi:hypothetical protein